MKIDGRVRRESGGGGLHNDEKLKCASGGRSQGRQGVGLGGFGVRSDVGGGQEYLVHVPLS